MHHLMILSPKDYNKQDDNAIWDKFRKSDRGLAIRINATNENGIECKPLEIESLNESQFLNNEETIILMVHQLKNVEYNRYLKDENLNHQLIKLVQKNCALMLLHRGEEESKFYYNHNKTYAEGVKNSKYFHRSSDDLLWGLIKDLVEAICRKDASACEQCLLEIINPQLYEKLTLAKLVFYPAYLKLSKTTKNAKESDFFYDKDDYKSVECQIDKKELRDDMAKLKEYLQKKKPIEFYNDYIEFCKRIDNQLSELANYK